MNDPIVYILGLSLLANAYFVALLIHLWYTGRK